MAFKPGLHLIIGHYWYANSKRRRPFMHTPTPVSPKAAALLSQDLEASDKDIFNFHQIGQAAQFTAENKPQKHVFPP